MLAGCGDDTGAGGTPTSAPTRAPSSAAPTGEVFPVTVTRTGGFAGFDDRVVIGKDGVASVSQRAKDPVRCKLDPSLLTTLTTALEQVDWAAVGSTKPTFRHPDDLIVAVSAGGGTARIEEPKLKPLMAPVSKLLTEATVPPGKLCKPV
ncbi:hypothetical protein FB561_7277 [Kribbella amoyensis]|uniref:Uncharacterized protein n=1 Tax=Kribbella amoyensis TaxID=996641 RepID=A0A561B3D5_9ACTN|nr:hypothetical protein FB561_7277 [Kribbella amoyensis]